MCLQIVCARCVEILASFSTSSSVYTSRCDLKGAHLSDLLQHQTLERQDDEAGAEAEGNARFDHGIISRATMSCAMNKMKHQEVLR